MRLIDADEAKHIAKTRLINPYDIIEVMAVLDKTPTIDAVPVVRCQDCIHYEIHKPNILENCERKDRLIPMKPDDFCSYGERRGDGL